ncbi:fibroblast growth factor 4A [Heterodontus francisci]|uniref:fibroblast growth factor 4A n=1 Tax=Heterodontus francisci TaxID=7792 RepID=UPI00355AEC12
MAEEAITRGHRFKVICKRTRGNMRKNMVSTSGFYLLNKPPGCHLVKYITKVYIHNIYDTTLINLLCYLIKEFNQLDDFSVYQTSLALLHFPEPDPTLPPLLLDWRRNGVTPLSNRATKRQFLYCSIGIGFHLQILPNGRVNGAHESSHYGIMELFSVKFGIVAIRAVVTRLFLAITSHGILYGSETFTEDCLFKEQMEENHYTTYSSHTHPRLYVALTKRGEAKNGSRARLQHPSTHFIPRLVRGS